MTQLDLQCFKTIVDRKVDPYVREACAKLRLCFICLNSKDIVSCNNIKDQICIVCVQCSIKCPKHDHYCRLHSGFQEACEICIYERIISQK